MEFPGYQLEQSISILRGVGLIFYSNFDRTFCEQTVETLIRRRSFAASNLDLLCLSMSHKKDAKLICVKWRFILGLMVARDNMLAGLECMR